MSLETFVIDILMGVPASLGMLYVALTVGDDADTDRTLREAFAAMRSAVSRRTFFRRPQRSERP